MVVELKMQWTIRETSEESRASIICIDSDGIYVRLLIFQLPVNWLVFLQIDGTLFPHFQYYDRVRIALCIEEIW